LRCAACAAAGHAYDVRRRVAAQRDLRHEVSVRMRRATRRTPRRTPNASALPLHMSHMCDTCTAHGTRDARRLPTTAFPAAGRTRAPRRRRTYATLAGPGRGVRRAQPGMRCAAAHHSPNPTSYACPAACPAAAVYCTRTRRIRLPPAAMHAVHACRGAHVMPRARARRSHCPGYSQTSVISLE